MRERLHFFRTHIFTCIFLIDFSLLVFLHAIFLLPCVSFFLILFSLPFPFFLSTTVCLVSVWTFQILKHLQSGSQLSLNQEVVEAPLQGIQPVTAASLGPSFAAVTTPTPSGCTTPSSTPLPLELHIDEDGGCPGSTSSVSSTLVTTSSRSLQYSRVDQLDDGDLVSAGSCQVESFMVSTTAKPSSHNPPDVLPSKDPSPGESPAAVRQSPVINSLSKSPSPVTVPLNTPKSPSPSNPAQSQVPQNVSQTPEPKTHSSVPRLSSPLPKSASPVGAPNISSATSVPKGSSPEIPPKCASPIPVPRLASPVPKTGSSSFAANVDSSGSPPTSSITEPSPKTAGPVLLPKLASPVTVSPNEMLVRSPPVVRKTYTVPGTSSPRASPLPAAPVTSGSLSSSPSEKQSGEVLDLKWPCRDPVLDDTLDKLLCPDLARLRETQTPASLIPGDEDRSWEEEDGIYPDYSREGTLTPMTESSWMDECFTPSTCPGTPDATMELPSQQPSAIERLSASGQVGRSTWLSQNKLLAERPREAS